MEDRLGRPLRDLRVSVTDRCKFRCTYCMPREKFGPDFAFVPRDELLTFEEITRVVAAAIRLGVRKVRLTGGEPLLRRDLHQLVAMLSRLPGLDDLALTTNGSLLAAAAVPLRAAGLGRVTVSLDALDDEVHARMADTKVPVSNVLEGIAAAAEAGLGPVKVNAVVRRGINEEQILPLARLGRERDCVIRFIEYMDVGTANGWCLDDVVPAEDILSAIAAEWPLEPVAPNTRGEVANRYRYRDGGGEIGVVASVTRPFCGECTRGRLSAVGEVFTCLFSAGGTDLRDLLRNGADDDALTEALAAIWRVRQDRYSELRSEATRGLPRVEMHYVGG